MDMGKSRFSDETGTRPGVPSSLPYSFEDATDADIDSIFPE